MAKITGVVQIRGKMDGVSYYSQKGVDGGLARKINEGLSKRVKESVAYHNTRLNNAEFGSAGSFAGAAVRAITDRQRTMLKDFATAQVAKYVRKIIVGDTTNPWGSRQLEGTNWQIPFLQHVSTFAKNDWNYYVGGTWETSAAVSGKQVAYTPNAELPTGWGQALLAAGADGAYVDMYAYRIMLEVPEGVAGRATSFVGLIGSDDAVIGESVTITEAAQLDENFTPVLTANSVTGVLVVVRPYKTVNSGKHILQELCTFHLEGVTVNS